jgi:hypothetical protein
MMTHEEETRNFLVLDDGVDEDEPTCPHCDPNPCRCLYDDETDWSIPEEE